MSPVMQGVIMSGVQHTDGIEYAVGGYPGHGFVLHQTPAGWAVHSTYDEMLHWVHRVDDDIWIAGANGFVLNLKTDGTAQARPDLTLTEELWGVFATAADDIWVVGGNPRATGATQAVILHFDGAQWTRMPLPELDRPCPALFKVWARSPHEIYFAGANGVLLTYDGNVLNQVPLELGDDLVSIWGNEDTVVVVGGRTRGVILTYTENEWTTQLLNQTSGLNGIWVGADTAVAVGQQGTVVEWSLSAPSSVMVSQPISILLHGIFETNSEGLVALGGTLDQPQPWTPVIIETKP